MNSLASQSHAEECPKCTGILPDLRQLVGAGLGLGILGFALANYTVLFCFGCGFCGFAVLGVGDLGYWGLGLVVGWLMVGLFFHRMIMWERRGYVQGFFDKVCGDWG